MTNPSAAEAAEHLERAINEAQRLGEHFPQRTKDEKKRMGHLQHVVPKLKRLAKSLPIEKAVSDEEQKVLDSLKPAAKSG
jgi:ribosomal protein S15P/S13E